ncbi:MAG TPA: pyrroloquinoline quinone biosynthesis protein PqqE [Hyphomicrobiales bacterium]|nr:pyrroloquinoline quinone biosynthesis protein PqqE [Hyphomicrobiales bacterium]
MVGQAAAEDLSRDARNEAGENVRAGPPLGMLAELTHRCPLQCPYCSNPLRLLKAGDELETGDWLRVFDQAAELGVLQIHLSGGEPTLRSDLDQFVERLAAHGVYSNLITAGVNLSADKIKKLAGLGLDHVQLSVQSVRRENADRITNYKGALARKRAFAGWVIEAGLPLTINAVTHRNNIDETEAFIQFALDAGAQRIEVANTQYYGWAAVNRAALMPGYEQCLRQADIVGAAQRKLTGILNIDYVPTDYYAKYPKPCMGGWANDVFNVTPNGQVLPCHAAESLTDMEFENVRERPLAEIWYASKSFNRFRGAGWMPEPCRSCERKHVDFGGCRCQAFAMTGDARATDPACSLSPHHHAMESLAGNLSSSNAPPAFEYRRIGRY